MKLEGEGKLLRIFIGESDHLKHKPLYEVIVMKAREMGLAGATVLRGVESYGANSRIHKAHLVELSRDLPLVIEIVDTEEKIRSFIPELDKILTDTNCGALVTLERIEVIRYSHDKR